MPILQFRLAEYFDTAEKLKYCAEAMTRLLVGQGEANVAVRNVRVKNT